MASNRSQHGGDSIEETTPLLRPDDNEEVRDAEGETESRVRKPPIGHKVLFIGNVVSMSLGVLVIAFLIATYCLLYGASRRFNFSEYWNFDQLMNGVAVSGIPVLLLTITNLVLLYRHKHPMPAWINFMFFGLTGIFALYLGFFASLERIGDPPKYCTKDLDDPHYRWGSGTYKECLAWAATYHPVVTTFSLLLPLFGFTQVVLFVFTVINLYTTGIRAGFSNRGRSWALPTGGVSVEVRINWGSPPQQTQPEPVRSEV